MSVGVLFVVDCTGSMFNIHQHLGNDLSKIVRLFEEENVPVQFGAIGFRDYKHEPATAFEIVQFDEDTFSLRTWFTNIVAFGGGSNRGESSLAGLIHGVRSINWPDVRRRVVAIFTDDRPHVVDFLVDGWPSVHLQLADADIEQIHLFTVNSRLPSYDNLDSPDYDVLRYVLAETNLVSEFDAAQLENAIRGFVRVSSGGDFGSSDVVVRTELTDTNPFDIEDINPFDLEDEATTDMAGKSGEEMKSLVSEEGDGEHDMVELEEQEGPEDDDLDFDWDDIG